VSDQSAEVVEFSKFYMENVPRLIAFLVCQGVSVIDAADCVQETLIAALPPVWATLEYGVWGTTERKVTVNTVAAGHRGAGDEVLPPLPLVTGERSQR
jgi:hypothetical protein